MAEITTTRGATRRSIGRMVRLEWFLRYGGEIASSPKNLGDVTGDTNTASLVGDSDLTQDTDFWRGDWLLLTATDGTQQERVIVESSSDGKLYPEWPLSAAPTSDYTYEIWGLWPPSDVNHKINMALRSAWRFFPNVVTNEQIVLQEDVTEYGILASDLNNLDTDQGDPSIAEVLKIWIEQSRNVQWGRITSTTSATVFTDENNPWSTDAEGNTAGSDFLISFYRGLGAGQLRELTSWDSDGVFTVDTDLEDFDTNTHYAVWDPSTDQVDWYRLIAARFDQLENPDVLYLTQNYHAARGMRLRVEYVAQSTDMAADSDVSAVPEEYLVYKALSILYDELVGDNRHDRSSHAGLAEYYDGLAQKFAQDEGRELPGATIWAEYDPGMYGGLADDPDPLRWGR